MKATWRVWRMLSQRRSDLIGQAVMAVGFCVATLIIVMCLGANGGLAQRDARTAWRNPTFDMSASISQSQGSAADRSHGSTGGLLVTVLDRRGGRAFTRSTYARLGPDAPIPPGLERIPAPGEVWVSPALADWADAHPDVLADVANPTGEIGADGLAHPQELSVIIGASADDRVFAEQPMVPMYRSDETFGPAEVDAWPTSSEGTDAALYRFMAAMGSVILIVPALAMIGGTARMMTGRRCVELATVRLVGATGRQAARMAIFDAARSSGLGAVLGVALSLPVLRAFESVEVGGGTWFAGDLMPSPATYLLVILAVVGVAIGSATLTLRRVNTNPLGVVSNDKPGGAVWARALGVMAAMAFFYATVNSANTSQFSVLAAWACVLGSTLLVGPLLVRVIGWLWLGVARRPVSLLAARRLLDDPKTAYRQVGGLALACLIAGTLAAASGAAMGGVSEADANTIVFAVPASAMVELRQQLEPLATDIDTQDFSGDDLGVIVIPREGVTTEQVRTLVNATFPDSLVASRAEETERIDQLVVDFQRASLIMIVVAGIAAAIGVASHLTTSIVDQQRPLTALRMTGVSFRSLAVARRRAVIVPLVLAAGSAGMLGIWTGVIFSDLAFEPRPFILVFLTILGAVGSTLAAEFATRPMMKRYTSDRSVLET